MNIIETDIENIKIVTKGFMYGVYPSNTYVIYHQLVEDLKFLNHNFTSKKGGVPPKQKDLAVEKMMVSEDSNYLINVLDFLQSR